MSRTVISRQYRRVLNSAVRQRPNPWWQVSRRPTAIPLAHLEASDALRREKSQKTLVIYDFDLSMANETSDTWLLEQFDEPLSTEFNARVQAGFPCWVEEIDEMFSRLHTQGITGEDVKRKIAEIPVFDANLQVIRELGESGATQMVVSDANTVYIESFLKRHRLDDYFQEIYSNPSKINEITGRFQVARFLPEENAHSCEWCHEAPNMCKGDIFEGILDGEGESFDRVLFVCDGTNDYCGALRLRSSDTVLCRRDLGLNALLERHGVSSLAPNVQFWSSGDELRSLIHEQLG